MARCAQILAPLLAAAAATAASADDSRAIPYREHEEVRLVLLPAVVVDRRGRPVRGLTRQDFRLFEDEVPQDIRYFSIEAQEPISVAFLLDVSGSMRQLGNLDAAKQAIRGFVDRQRPRDRVALVGFADGRLEWVAGFTSDRAGFLERLQIQEGYGQTALRDAIAAAPNLLGQAESGPTAVVLITDGVDNASRLTLDEALEAARRAGFPIYTLGLVTRPDELLRKGEAGAQPVEAFSVATGGKLFAVRDAGAALAALAAIEEELRYRYVIGYDVRGYGGWRSVRLESRKRGLEVRTRAGYSASR